MKRKKLTASLVMLFVIVGLTATINSTIANITIDPNPMDKNTTITVSFLNDVRADVIIETEDGTLVKTLFTGDLDAGVQIYYWNRLSDDGVYVPEGKYYVTINYESRYTSTKKTLILK